jgi:hypothetical protein
MYWTEDEKRHYNIDHILFDDSPVDTSVWWTLEYDQTRTIAHHIEPPPFGDWIPLNTWMIGTYIFGSKSRTPKGGWYDYSYYLIRKLQFNLSLILTSDAPDWVYVRVNLHVWKDGRIQRLVRTLYYGWTCARVYRCLHNARVVSVCSNPPLIDLGFSAMMSIPNQEIPVIAVYILNYKPDPESQSITPINPGRSILSVIYTDDYIE